jgi:hypothetical protein
MITHDKFYKLCKYSVRLEKSFVSNNSNDYAKYCSHLKYHIGNQIGSGNNQEIDRLFNKLIQSINDNSIKYNIGDIKKKLDETEKKLQESNSNENIKNKLEDLKINEYDVFINLLKELFNKIYNEEVSNEIIKEIKQNETWKNK